MERNRFVKQRRYEGRSDYLGAFGVASCFTFVGILAIIFYFTDIHFIQLRVWGYYLFIPAFFIWIGGISSYINQDRLKKEVLAAIDSYQSSGAVNIDNLASDLMMDRPSLMRLLIDLRVDRKIKFRVDSKTGEIIFGESYTPLTVDAEKIPKSNIDIVYCPQCGVRMSADSIFCPNCGVSIQ